MVLSLSDLVSNQNIGGQESANREAPEAPPVPEVQTTTLKVSEVIGASPVAPPPPEAPLAPPVPSPASFTQPDGLTTLNAKLESVREYVRGVARHYYTGCIVHGRGGIGKSFAVLDELRTRGVGYILTNSRLTGRGLVDLLQEFPDSLHVLEDCESLLDDKNSWGVLRSALFSQSKEVPPVRQISWRAFKTVIEFAFRGQIIYIANRELDANGEVNAIKSRVPVIELKASNEEVESLMFAIASHGYTHGREVMTPEECAEVTAFIVKVWRNNKVTKSGKQDLDLRTQKLCFNTYLSCRASDTDYESQIENLISEKVEYSATRADFTAQKVALAKQIDALPLTSPEKVAKWMEESAKLPLNKTKKPLSQSTFYEMKKRQG